MSNSALQSNGFLPDDGRGTIRTVDGILRTLRLVVLTSFLQLALGPAPPGRVIWLFLEMDRVRIRSATCGPGIAVRFSGS